MTCNFLLEIYYIYIERENLEEHILPNQLFDLLIEKWIFATINLAFNMIVWLKYFILKRKKKNCSSIIGYLFALQW